MLLDAHFHLDQYHDCVPILDEIERNGIKAIAVSNGLASYIRTRLLIRGRRNISVAVGFHPARAMEWEWELDQVLAVMELEPLIGEIGLDGVDRTARIKWTKPEVNAQYKALEAILDLCDGRDKFLTLHSQNAARSLVEVTKQYRLPRAVWHWYTGDEAPLHQIVEMGHWLSVGPAINRQQSRLRRWIAEWVPRERILTETDGPYGDRGHLRRDALRSVVSALATIWQCTMEEAEAQIQSNYEQLVRGIQIGDA